MSSIDVSDNAIAVGVNVTNSQLAWHPAVRRNAERLPSLKPSLHHGLTPGEGNLKTP